MGHAQRVSEAIVISIRITTIATRIVLAIISIVAIVITIAIVVH